MLFPAQSQLVNPRGQARAVIPASVCTLTCLVLMATATASPAGLLQWRVDHHMHLGSVDLCERVGDCLPSHDPPAVFGSDAVAALDEAGVDRGVVISSGYLYGLASLNLEPEAVARWTRRETPLPQPRLRSSRTG